MFLLILILCLLSVFCFIAAAFGASFRGLNLISLGLVFFALVPLIELIADSNV